MLHIFKNLNITDGKFLIKLRTKRIKNRKGSGKYIRHLKGDRAWHYY